MKKKRILFVSASLTAVVLMIGFIAAFLTDHDIAENTAEIGIVDIELVEDPIPNRVKTVNETTYYSKPIYVQNAAKESGAVPCYIRVRIDFSSSEIQDKTAFAASGADCESAAYTAASDFTTYAGTMTNWEYIPDSDNLLGGYFYYRKPLNPGEKTDDLLKWVKTTYVSNDSESFYIYVYLEAVQTILDADGTAKNTYNAEWTAYLNKSNNT